MNSYSVQYLRSDVHSSISFNTKNTEGIEKRCPWFNLFMNFISFNTEINYKNTKRKLITLSS